MFDQCLYFNTTALARQLEKEWTKAFAPFDLTPPQAFLLRVIVDRPGLLQREIAQTLSIARPTATRALDGLEAKGLVQRRPTARDGREHAVHPTTAGEALGPLLNEASGKVTRRLKQLLGDETFSETVRKVKGARSALE